MAIVAENRKDLSNAIIKWDEELKRSGLATIYTKTKVMQVNRERGYVEITVGSQQLEMVDNSEYPGMNIKNQCDLLQD